MLKNRLGHKDDSDVKEQEGQEADIGLSSNSGSESQKPDNTGSSEDHDGIDGSGTRKSASKLNQDSEQNVLVSIAKSMGSIVRDFYCESGLCPRRVSSERPAGY